LHVLRRLQSYFFVHKQYKAVSLIQLSIFCEQKIQRCRKAAIDIHGVKGYVCIGLAVSKFNEYRCLAYYQTKQLLAVLRRDNKGIAFLAKHHAPKQRLRNRSAVTVTAGRENSIVIGLGHFLHDNCLIMRQKINSARQNMSQTGEDSIFASGTYCYSRRLAYIIDLCSIRIYGHSR